MSIFFVHFFLHCLSVWRSSTSFVSLFFLRPEIFWYYSCKIWSSSFAINHMMPHQARHASMDRYLLFEHPISAPKMNCHSAFHVRQRQKWIATVLSVSASARNELILSMSAPEMNWYWWQALGKLLISSCVENLPVLYLTISQPALSATSPVHPLLLFTFDFQWSSTSSDDQGLWNRIQVGLRSCNCKTVIVSRQYSASRYTAQWRPISIYSTTLTSKFVINNHTTRQQKNRRLGCLRLPAIKPL